MIREYILKEHADIFEHLDDYALVKMPSGDAGFIIMYKPRMAFVLIEEFSDEVKELMIEKGVQIADNQDEIRPPGFRPSHLTWDDEKKEWRKIYEDEIAKILEEKARNKPKR